jgi:hypothetical protein
MNLLEMNNRTRIIVGGSLVVVVVVAFLAFGVFGIQTLFTDKVVSEADPFAGGDGASGLQSDFISDDLAEEINDEMVDKSSTETVEDEPMEEGGVVRVIEGTFSGRAHPGSGTAVVLNDGSAARFLRFEEDFVTDNGPDLNVYLVAGAGVEDDSGLFDDDFVDLGNLKGNIGSQNYEIAEDVDLERYDTVVIWCVRFGVAFSAADLT